MRISLKIRPKFTLLSINFMENSFLPDNAVTFEEGAGDSGQKKIAIQSIGAVCSYLVTLPFDSLLRFANRVPMHGEG